MARKQKPFDKIFAVRSRLDLYVEYGEQALQGQSVDDFLRDVAECYGYLIDFRNIINGMVRFDEAPSDAVLPYLSDETLAKASEQ